MFSAFQLELEALELWLQNIHPSFSLLDTKSEMESKRIQEIQLKILEYP